VWQTLKFQEGTQVSLVIRGKLQRHEKQNNSKGTHKRDIQNGHSKLTPNSLQNPKTMHIHHA